FIPCSSSRSQPVEASAPSVAVEPIAVIPLVDGGDEKRPSRFSSVRRLGNKDHRWNPRLSDRSAHRAPLRTLGEEFLLLTFMVALTRRRPLRETVSPWSDPSDR